MTQLAWILCETSWDRALDGSLPSYYKGPISFHSWHFFLFEKKPKWNPMPYSPRNRTTFIPRNCKPPRFVDLSSKNSETVSGIPLSDRLFDYFVLLWWFFFLACTLIPLFLNILNMLLYCLMSLWVETHLFKYQTGFFWVV